VTAGGAPTIRWSGRGSLAIAAVAGAARALAGPARPVLAILDRAGEVLARSAVAVAAVALVGVPLLRLAFGDGAAAVPAVVLAGAAGTALLLRLAARLHEGDDRALVVRVVLLGLGLRVAMAATLAALGGFPDEHGTYDPVAREVARDWSAGEGLPPVPVAQGRWAYLGLLSGSYLLVGPWMAAGRLLGVLLGLGAALLAGEVARPLGGRRAAALTVAVLALHPEQALWSTTLSRDALSVFLVLASLAVVLRAPGRLLPWRILLAAGPLALLAMNSLPQALALGTALAGAALVEGAAALREGARGFARAALALLLAAVAAGLVLDRLGPWLTLEQVSLLRSGALRGDLGALAARGGLPADFLPGLRLCGPWDVLLLLPAGAAFVLFAPWPWTAVHALRAAYAGPALAGAVVTVLGVAGIAGASFRGARAAVAPVLFVLASLATLALLEGNSGIVVRHRLPLGAVLAVGAGLLLAGFERGSEQRRS